MRRHRTVRAAATSVASIGVVGGAVWGLDAFRHGDALTPGAIPPGTTSDSPSSSPSSASAMPLEDTLTFPSGKTLDEVSAKLADAYGVPQVDARAAIAASVTSIIPEASTAEGWPMPGTFDLTDQASLSDAADMLVTARVAELTDLGVPRADWQTVITKASLVEREAKLDVDRPKIASVIDNRLAKEMRLELDSTVLFAAPGEGVFTTDEQRATDSPYNTYVYQGLPPGAIATPSDESIRAVLNPAQGDWLFFVTVNLNTGETAFGSTFEEHQANVMLLQDWIAAQPAN
ncbi:MAG: endolytic transglycosylase MltG [Demequinaceae bacterium]|nr:endolytic transglycosylase MltG [Demequinaceae bacterium]